MCVRANMADRVHVTQLALLLFVLASLQMQMQQNQVRYGNSRQDCNRPVREYDLPVALFPIAPTLAPLSSPTASSVQLSSDRIASSLTVHQTSARFRIEL